MWVQLKGESINLDNVCRFWLEKDLSDDKSIIPTLKIQLSNHRSNEWLEFEIYAEDDSGKSSIELAESMLSDLRSLLGQHILL
ncbi:hypothetical protein WDW89_00515 [Deltaproteobacteria bacterium TL4]